jgi:hypothetical protein
MGLRAQRQWAAVTAPQRSPLRGEMRDEMRMALVMVRADENGAPSVRLVQDFGCPDDPDAPLAGAPAPTTVAAVPPRRGRGRPSGGKTRKKGETKGAGKEMK